MRASMGFGLLDPHQIWAADTELRRATGISPDSAFCGDGIHGRGDRNMGTEEEPRGERVCCDKLYVEAVIAMQHLVELVRKGHRLDTSWLYK